jgi:hypothetical protein
MDYVLVRWQQRPNDTLEIIGPMPGTVIRRPYAGSFFHQTRENPAALAYSAPDISVPLLGIDRKVECKVRADGFAEIYRWIDGNYALVIKGDRDTPLVVTRLRNALEVAKVAEGKAAEAALPLPEEGRASRISALPDRR